ncbi:unnamed protein product [Rotaria sordida]|uniref:Uncharacterized protein n=1 Tax=Rotaria sordida TaxID=392033 RepID=A0A815IQ10_9BILA|nr:unnamed protein product [Rotaria sordida]
MKKRSLMMAGCILVACQLSLMLTHQYFGSQVKKSVMSNLTSLMIPFEHMTRNSTFCCSDVTLQERYKLEFQQLEHYRLGQSYKQPTIHRHSKQWKWPFIDIFFYTDNSTHIESDISIEKDIIFPLILRPIATLWLPGPRNVHMFIKKISEYYYSDLAFDDKCYLQKYSHRDEKEKYKQKTVNCTQLRNVYPYIRRICDNDYCDEYFMLNDVTTLYVLKMAKDK